jgi:hypothetical protein
MSEWQQLLARCQQWHREQAEWQRRSGEQYVPDPQPTTFAPAIEAQIAREEARLGVRLPPSLRSFYLQSNGHGVVGNFIWAVRPVEQLGWLRDVEPELYDLLFEDDAASARSLLLSGAADASYWLLDPGSVDERGEWRAGRWSSWNPGMNWIAADFFGLFENEVATAERLLARQKTPPPPPGTGRPRNAQSVGDVNSTAAQTGSLARNGYTWVRAEGFASIVTLSAPATARVGEWIPIHATRRSGPWNPVRQEDVGAEEINLFEPLIFEPEVAANLALRMDPPGNALFNTEPVAGADPASRSVMFSAPGVYTLQGHSAFPLPVLSNTVTIRVG